MNNHFVILGGMGTLATESFVRLINRLADAHSDQDYMDYLVFNHASVPDRSAYILGESKDSPAPALLSDVEQANATDPAFIVLTCNTAHAFYNQLALASRAPLLHMPALTIARLPRLASGAKARVGFLGTRGSVASGVYASCAAEQGYELVVPDQALQAAVTYLIDHDVKGNAFLNFQSYQAILEQMREQGDCDLIILGCTELSLLEEQGSAHNFNVIDAQAVLATETVNRAKAFRRGEHCSPASGMGGSQEPVATAIVETDGAGSPTQTYSAQNVSATTHTHDACVTRIRPYTDSLKDSQPQSIIDAHAALRRGELCSPAEHGKPSTTRRIQ